MRVAIAALKRGRYTFFDQLDGDGFEERALRIAVALTIRRDSLTFDFTGTAPQASGPINANLAITRSAVGYALRCLLRGAAPFNDGVLAPATIIAPYGTVVNAAPPAAVAAGNVETSQRIVDVVLGALAQAAPAVIPAASCGTMTNTSFGNSRFTYYETIGGGAGATARRDGASGVQTHMTNTLNTPIEVLERIYPLRVRRYLLRRGSGGAGARRGGDGIVREFEACEEVVASVLAERQRSRPYGSSGGEAGAAGRTTRIRGGKSRKLTAMASVVLARGERLRLETPGGGGHGAKRGQR
jgi:N-methylhydantoinase B/oxoprolinase/acetone carboxylase alpha subunit